MEQEITEREIQELRLLKAIEKLEKQQGDAWHRFYTSDAYRKHPDYIEYQKIQSKKWELENQLKELRENETKTI